MSEREKKAKRIRFDRHLTVVVGGNDTGKSSLLKSVFWCLGADSAVAHPRWKNANVTGLLHFSIDAVPYSIVRRGKFFALFSGAGQLIDSFDKVTSGLGPFLAKLLNFRLVLLANPGSRSKKPPEIIVPPPAYFFLPFYVDQDASWKKTWAGFANISQLKAGWKHALAEYHTGLKPNEYYMTKAELDVLTSSVQELAQQTQALLALRARSEQAASHELFNMNLEQFRAELDALVSECEQLRKVEAALKQDLLDLHDERIAKEQEIVAIQAAMNEAAADFAYASEDLAGQPIECSLCGTSFSNSFVERLSIAEDEDRLAEMLIEAKTELREVRGRIEQQNAKFTNSRAEVRRIEQILNSTAQQITLASLIQNEGRRELRQLLQSQATELRTEISVKQEKIGTLRKEMRRLQDTKRIGEITSEYRARMRLYLSKLGVETLPEEEYEKIDANINETGSDLPRALLAYYFSIFHVIHNHTTSTVCPLVIDEPNQQGQDTINLPAMLSFIRDNRPEGSQVILGVENLHGVEMLTEQPTGKKVGSTEVLAKKYSLLQEADYESVHGEIFPLLQTAVMI